MKTLVIIPARGGSKGIPHKNIRPLGGKPLICHAIDQARSVAADADICVTTDDPEIIRTVEDYGLHVPFVRPARLATDTCGTYEVLLHALDHYEQQGLHYDAIVLLQPTSPFRSPEDIRGAMALFGTGTDMVVSVTAAKANPYYNCFEEDADGFLKLSKGNGQYVRRQDAPEAWEYNGAVYVIDPRALRKSPLSKFRHIRKYVMDEIHSLDLDTMLDWKIAELMLKEGMLDHNEK